MDEDKSVGAFAAKTHFSTLLEQVKAGASFVITKHGVPVARLVPLSAGMPPANAGAAARTDFSFACAGDCQRSRHSRLD
jgi:prevent-host-death family protein